MNNQQIIEVTRQPNQDATQAASQAAREAGTQLNGNMRWYGENVPSYREATTKDGRIVRVNEPS